ncbi:hypothetical protein COO60DRAFT_1639479 [Scenedesmus sp. NREL 46B-D3]|nr:hypothetical protein COO60DRAFT_1639479 [Scenedesmus sp. NREL 46B-D3]
MSGLHLRWRVASHLLGLLACVLTGATDDAALALYQALNLDSNEGKSYGLLDNVTELGDKGKSWKGQVTHKGKSWEGEYTHKGDQMSPLVLARDDAGSINKMPLSSGAAAATPAARQRRGWDLPKKTFQDRTTQQSLPRWCSPQGPPGTPAQDSSQPLVYSSSSNSSSSSTDNHKSSSSSSSSSRNVNSITRSSSSSSSSKSSSSRSFSAAQSPVRSLSSNSKTSTPLAARSSRAYRHKHSAAAAAAAGGGGGLDAAGKAADTRIKSAEKPVWK